MAWNWNGKVEVDIGGLEIVLGLKATVNSYRHSKMNRHDYSYLTAKQAVKECKQIWIFIFN